MTVQKPFVHRLQVAFGDADMAGILYYPRLFHYGHLAFEAWFGEVTGASYRDWLIERDIGFPAVRMEAEYLAPLALGAAVDFEVRFRRIGGASLEVRWLARIGANLHARIDGTLVCVSMKAFKAQPIPAELRQHFERYLEPEDAA